MKRKRDATALLYTANRGPFGQYVPIIMLTAHSERMRVCEARDAGVNEFCTKPVIAHELMRKVAAVIERPRPFIRAPGFFGPQRRALADLDFGG